MSSLSVMSVHKGLVQGPSASATKVLRASMGIPLVTFVITYIISLTVKRDGYHLIEYPYLFLSNSIESKPASNVGTFGLVLSFGAVLIVSFVRYILVNSEIARQRQNLSNDLNQNLDRAVILNNRAVKSCVVAIIGALGVASFQSSTDDCGGTRIIVGIHLLFALTFFFGAAYYVVLQHRIDLVMPSIDSAKSRFQRKLAVWGLIFLGVFFLVVAVGGSIAYRSISTPATNSTSPSSSLDKAHFVRIPKDVYIWVFLMSLCEITVLLVLLTTLTSFIESFRSKRLSFIVIDADAGVSNPLPRNGDESTISSDTANLDVENLNSGSLRL